MPYWYKSEVRILVVSLLLFPALNSAVIFGRMGKPISYPAVQPFSKTVDVPSVSTTSVVTVINAPTGKSLYKLQCHSAGYSGDPDFDYSGDFECRLSSISQKDKYSTLLTEDLHQSRDWESRGRFFASELKGQCALIPNFGSVRRFRLRGMILTLKIISPRFAQSGNLKSLKLNVQVQQDNAALTPIAEATPIPKAGIPAGCKLQEHFVDVSQAIQH
ncbi:MAG: hypothetical protein DMG60_15460 [Acidobacteria bacterium]|nr:MAG: hypothetical protein DMG60_15460 [Acidobacteriota bacterium]